MPEIRRADDRFRTDGDGVTTWHSFSYGQHYDPDNVGFGPLIAINTERIDAGRGYELHHHADVEIVTWVLEGALQHQDGTGHRGIIEPGTAQRLSAGTGVQHSEQNASDDVPLVFVQMMLRSDHDAEPEYAQVDVDLRPGELTPTVDVHTGAELFVVRLTAGQSVAVPAARRSLVHVTDGSLSLGDATLTAGDEARLTDEGEYDLRASSAATALIWQLQR
ncbi:pirin family protein [Aeromicrobium ginsengisoli]|uniref:Pirin family protein n=1 Tax=Aeromicrobium ginsengisoli TaxID=363867 RepID=A0A5M4FAI0_9ACTN|nr:pirin family protein [Aeromicrobium ginsengisoli]KAA1395277.1 pirin family protein [Aeromicrobium ginsengisoli]